MPARKHQPDRTDARSWFGITFAKETPLLPIRGQPVIKAGRPGSSPDGTASDWQSQPLSALLADIGEAVANLSTAVVGLDAVEKGHERVEAVLVRVFEALCQHSVVISRLPRLSEVVGKWDGKHQWATKTWDTYKAVVGETYLVSSAVLVVHWRNRIVHPDSNARLQSHQKNLLRNNDAEIAEKYKGLSVDCLLCHFEEGRPTLKDISSLIAMAINLAREVDRSISSALSKEDFDSWLEYFELPDAIKKVAAETKPEKRAASVRRVFQTRAPMLLDGYERYYVVPGSD